VIDPASAWVLARVIAGGQTGADQAGLRAAKALGYATTGMMPKGFLTEDGPRPDLATEYAVTESHFTDYAHRTRMNVINADGTLIFHVGALDGGSALTERVAIRSGKPVRTVQLLLGVRVVAIPDAASLREWIRVVQLRTLNIAGNRESKSPGIGVAVETLLLEILRRP
jgi:hypothetical protein